MTPSAVSSSCDALAEQVVELGRRHPLLKLRPAEDGREEPVGLEEGLLPEAEVVDADDSRQAVLQVAGRWIDLADAVPDDAMCVVIEVGAGRRDAVDEASLDERDEARLMETGRRHRAAERQKDRAVLLDAAAHELVGRALLPPDVRRKPVHEDFMRSLLARDRAGTNVGGLFESTTQGRAVRGSLRHGGR